MCYNRRAVERAAKHGLPSAGPKPATAASSEAAPQPDGSSVAAKNHLSAPAERPEDRSAAAEPEGRSEVVREEHALLYCPVCSQRLESRRCKLICQVCGYYMSCADYY